MSPNLSIERLFGGQPIISPVGTGWQSGVTFNSAAVLLDLIPEHLPVIQALLGPTEVPRPIVALHYRARPKSDPGFTSTRSYIGLSVHEPDLTLIRRFERPVLSPDMILGPDVLGAEDPRVTWLDGAWWMVYCGVQPLTDLDPEKTWLGAVCLARSSDLLEWTKCGALEGFCGDRLSPESNKDGVLFPDRIAGKVVMLHRPMKGDISTWSTAIAIADQPEGPYTDLGSVHGPMPHPGFVKSWSGAGAVPIKIGPGRYLSIEHTGNYLDGQRRKYVLDAFLYDFNRWDPEQPESLVRARLDNFMSPETDFEVHGPYPDSVANVVFTCGAYVHEGWLYLVYGGGDSFILAARIRFQDLILALEMREEISDMAVVA